MTEQETQLQDVLTDEENIYLAKILEEHRGRRGPKPKALLSLLEKHQPRPEEPDGAKLDENGMTLMVHDEYPDCLGLFDDGSEICCLDLVDAKALHEALPTFIKYLDEVKG